MHKFTAVIASIGLYIAWSPAFAFCGFYVARADQALFNDASQVVLVRDENRTVVTMNSNFRGEVDEFAIVIPVPTILERSQVNVADKALIEHLDAYTAPRLVEYFDDDPCQVLYRYSMAEDAAVAAAPMAARKRAKNLGVTIEAEYTVGEYDILILSAAQSEGLTQWLSESGYNIPAGAESTIHSYLKQDMKFFVAKVNLDEQSKLGYRYLRPIQMAFESPKFMLPIRLGMVNADGPQDMYVYALTKTGRVESSNYRTIKIPSGMDLPVSIKEDFGDFYQAMFNQQYEKNNRNATFLEYAWDMAWCDPCAADPLSSDQLRKLGVFWVGRETSQARPQNQVRRIAPSNAVDVFVTRLHVRYDAKHFPDDLRFIETGDRKNFQGRYVIRHPWQGQANACPAAKTYLETTLPTRQREEAKRLANLTGWPLSPIETSKPNGANPEKWWERLWH
ncbi:MAG: DUF2330 domain-containing protein [Pseudomonadota bacterium]